MKTDNPLNVRLIVDFDDTLCLHPPGDTSDILGGIPNTALIKRLNELFDKGYEISIFTARGHFSAPSREDAIAMYRPKIKEWLEIHGVKYTDLSFNKPYGIIYIDDKSIRPDELHLLEGF